MKIDNTIPEMKNLKSQLVTSNQMETEEYKNWLAEMKEENRFHRKQWEHIFILQALQENGMLKDGSKGLGFGVGTESLPAVMAKYGCSVLATEINIEKPNEKGWVTGRDTDTHMAALNAAGICDNEKFNSLVSYRDVDMNQVPEDLKDFDFTWSSCSLEHLGSLKHGEEFIFNSLNCLKPGGIAVHTTEYTFTKNYTVEEASTVFYRKKDILALAERLTAEGHAISLNLYKGNRFLDWYIDIPPHRDKNHVKLLVSKQSKLIITTSIGLLIKKKSAS